MPSSPSVRPILARLPAALLLLGLWHPDAGAAPETGDLTALPLESLTAMQVSTASRFVQSASEAPSSVRIIRREDIHRHGWRTLAEALGSLPGFQTVSDKAYAFGGARGFLLPGDYNTRFLLLLDGQRINDNVYQQAMLGDEFPLGMDLIERIEYVPGPGSSVYGGNAIFGVINVITRPASTLPPAAFTTLADSRGRAAASLTGARRLASGAGLMAAAELMHDAPRDTRYDDPYRTLLTASGQPTPDGWAEDRDRMTARRLLLRYADGGLTLTARYNDRRVEPSSALYGSLFNDPDQYVRDSGWSLSGRHESAPRPALSLESSLELASSAYHSTSAYLDNAGSRYLNHDRSDGRWLTGEVRLLYTGLDRHKLIGGVAFRHDLESRQRNHDLGLPVNPAVDIRAPGNEAGLYLQDEWLLPDHWRLNAGLRLDHEDGGGDTVASPRLGLIRPDRSGRTWKLLAGRAWRPANAYERHYGNGINYLANPGLAPETIHTLEGVLEQSLDESSRLTASVWHYSLEDLISQETVGAGSLQYRNQSRIRARGLELVWDTARESGLSMNVAFSGSRLRDAGGMRIGYSPSWMLKARAGAPLHDGDLTAAGELACLPRTGYDWQGLAQTLPGHCLVNLSLATAGRSRGSEFRLRLINATGRKIGAPASGEVPAPLIPGTGRTLEAGWRHAF